MAIIGLGTDVADIERIEKILQRSGMAFAERILVPSELTVFHSLKQQGRYLAKRFSAKEAASKALGTGIACGVSFQDFEISNDKLGKPVLTLHGQALNLAHQRQVKHIHLSISDEKRYAMATVILES
ncbi:MULTISPECIES: holo-ACP synthase [Vibrio]|uniref:Holo-[acyl-carrier-protein] synthase n=1 Tax=Vibrio casei TaxID=673372 RepID=A0A368LLB4_9VIBR|nr:MULTISPECIES: holo-ACP synthase [Vibrio]RCS72684.1 holo-ACP synthase [Vibrio casei]SJN23555.1 Holo-[acyl-carrier protein] synthase [Vibrio casei]HBV75672.1 holo-ACP synthase [Vibrio sp.]